MNKIFKSLGIAGAGLLVAAGVAFAATISVTSINTQGWSTADTRTGGAISFVADSTSPDGGNGALQITTDATTTSKAQYMHEANVDLADVNELGYYTKQNSASFVGGDASYQLPVCLGGIDDDGDCVGFTTFVYEPYENGTVTPDVWQQRDVDAGQFWSSRSYTNGTCTVVAGGGGAPFYTLAGLQTACLDAVVVGFGVNIGSNNPSYNVEADLVDFNGTTYDFVYTNTPTNKDQCKKNGYMDFTDADGNAFKNQGQCVSYTNHI